MPITIPDDLPYTPSGIECLRLGARRGGEGIGCCAMDVIQGFNNDPDKICPQQPFFNGDSWAPEFYLGSDMQLCVGGDGITNEMAFMSHITHGSFSPDTEIAADHAFVAVLTDDQCNSSIGKKWLAILKREGFEWKGCTSNSVYGEYHPNHIFMLIRSTHNNMEDSEIESLRLPPPIWEKLPAPTETPEERFATLLTIFGQAHTPKANT
jgi:hypothetical protein